MGNSAMVSSFNERFNVLCDGSRRNDTELAKELHVSKQTLSAWRSGIRSPKQPTIIMIAQYFNVSVEWLMGFNVEATKQPATVDDGLTEGQRKLIDFARSLSDDDAAFALQFLRTALEAMQQRREADRGSM